MRVKTQSIFPSQEFALIVFYMKKTKNACVQCRRLVEHDKERCFKGLLIRQMDQK